MSDKDQVFEQRICDLIGTELKNDNRNYGVIVDYYIICNNSENTYILILDNGKKIEAKSALRFLSAYAKKVSGKSQNVYPDGSDFAIRNRAIRVKSGIPNRVMGGNVNNIAQIGSEKVNITTYVSSSNE